MVRQSDRWMLLVSLALVACGSGDDDAGGVDIAGSFGIVDSTGAEEATGTVEGQRGFGVSVSDVALVYISSSSDASCGDLSGYLDSVGEPYDPSSLFAADRCNLLMLISDGYPAEGREFVDDPYGATWSINCTLGEGEFVYEERDTGDWDYYWSERQWQGNAQEWSASLTGGDGSEFAFEMSLSEMNGNFPYESFESFPASGSVSGTATLEWCDDLSSAALIEAYL